MLKSEWLMCMSYSITTSQLESVQNEGENTQSFTITLVHFVGLSLSKQDQYVILHTVGT